MRDVTPSDFVAWVSTEKGLKIVELAEELGVSMRFDPNLEFIKTSELTIQKRNEGALRTSLSRKEYRAFLRVWKERNPQEKQSSLDKLGLLRKYEG